MPAPLDRRRFLTAAAATGALAALPLPALAEPFVGDAALGPEDAPVTVIEYALVTCPACAGFHADTWPKVRAEYIEAGKVRFIMRELIPTKYHLWASMVARCGGEEAFYPIMGQIFKKQKTWSNAPEGQIGQELAKIGRLNGLSQEQLNTCLSDEDYARSIIEYYQRNMQEHTVENTPTFFINGEKHVGNMPFEEFSGLIEAAL